MINLIAGFLIAGGLFHILLYFMPDLPALPDGLDAAFNLIFGFLMLSFIVFKYIFGAVIANFIIALIFIIIPGFFIFKAAMFIWEKLPFN